MIKVNVKYRLQEGNMYYKPGVYKVSNKKGSFKVTKEEAEKMLKLPFVTRIKEEKAGKVTKTATKTTSSEPKGNGDIDNDNADSNDSNDSEDDSGAKDFWALSDEEIKELYFKKTWNKAWNKKIDTLITELTK